MMWHEKVVRSTLLLLAVVCIAVIAYGFAWNVWGLLDRMSTDVVWAVGMAVLLTAWLAYAKWALKQLRNTRREEQWYEGDNASYIRRLQATRPINRSGVERAIEHLSKVAPGVSTRYMEALETLTHAVEVPTDRVVPGSAASASIGLDLIDESFD